MRSSGKDIDLNPLGTQFTCTEPFICPCRPRDNEPFVQPSDLKHPSQSLLPAEAGLYLFDPQSEAATDGPIGHNKASAATRDAALLQFMNSPHPMEMLGKPESYGAHGTIMRYHRITHYSAALASLLMAPS